MGWDADVVREERRRRLPLGGCLLPRLHAPPHPSTTCSLLYAIFMPFVPACPSWDLPFPTLYPACLGQGGTCRLVAGGGPVTLPRHAAHHCKKPATWEAHKLSGARGRAWDREEGTSRKRRWRAAT